MDNVYVILIEYEIRNNNAVSVTDTISINEFGRLFNVMKSGLAMSAVIKVFSYSPDKEPVVLREIHV